MGAYYEDLEVGMQFTSPPYTFTEEEIIRFATEYDNQPMHTDPVAAKDTAFGQLVASGWQSAAVSMKLNLLAGLKIEGGNIGRAILGIDWPSPILPGDTVFGRYTIDKMEPSSREGAPGKLWYRMELVKENGDVACTATAIVMAPRKSVSEKLP